MKRCELELSSYLRGLKQKNLGFCSGSFDLTHAGHILFFEECKKFCDKLVVCVGSDIAISTYKGKDRPILNESIRLKTIQSLKPVDEAFLDWQTKPDIDSFLHFIFQNLQPDYYFINDDLKDYDIDNRTYISSLYNTEIKIMSRECPKEFNNISTSNIINKIKCLA